VPSKDRNIVSLVEIEITRETIDYVIGELLKYSRDGTEPDEDTATRIIITILSNTHF
jgi:hypothetical protein